MSYALSIHNDHLRDYIDLDSNQDYVQWVSASSTPLLADIASGYLHEDLVTKTEQGRDWHMIRCFPILVDEQRHIVEFIKSKSIELVSTRSIGLGHTITPQDAGRRLTDSIDVAMRNNLESQMKVKVDCLFQIFNDQGIIVRNTTAGRELGIVRFIEASQMVKLLNTEDVIVPRWTTIEKLNEQIHVYDEWSKLIIPHLDSIIPKHF